MLWIAGGAFHLKSAKTQQKLAVTSPLEGATSVTFPHESWEVCIGGELHVDVGHFTSSFIWLDRLSAAWWEWIRLKLEEPRLHHFAPRLNKCVVLVFEWLQVFCTSSCWKHVVSRSWLYAGLSLCFSTGSCNNGRGCFVNVCTCSADTRTARLCVSARVVCKKLRL